MRVTQSMLSNNMLRNLNSSFSKMSKLQDQINSGSKISRPSDDPVVAIKGMGYRTDLGKIEQFTRNLNEANSWLDSTDEALDQVGSALKRVQELVTQAGNDTNTAEDRQSIQVEISQIQQQIRDVANTQISGKYIFSGSHTSSPLFKDTASTDVGADAMISITDKLGYNNDIRIEVADGIQLAVNSPAYDLFKGVDEMMAGVNKALKDGLSGDDIRGKLTDIQNSLNNVLEVRADVGAKQNRTELLSNRFAIQEVNVTKQMSLNEDVDYAEAITEMTTQESIHQAALSVGAKIIRQTLVDFL
ncbi:flagellar hook-associated protein FlgL [Solibacillus sp. FSL H8-0538]|uniref:flagellar hook-associated protein FlgL n=1 Tax=Solibacillus sp. FSL H8-0538 TaxID=2921400 RepID=UPI0030FB18B5